MIDFAIGLIGGAGGVWLTFLLWGWSRRGRQLLAVARAEERLRAIHVDALSEVARGAERVQRTYGRAGFGSDSAPRPPVIHAPLRALVHELDQEARDV